jgi:intracellular septation protein A
MALWTYRRPFLAGGLKGEVVQRSGLLSEEVEFILDGRTVQRRHTRYSDPEALKIQHFSATLPDGARLEVDLGAVGWTSVGIVVRVDGELVHESHPGRRLGEKAEQMQRFIGEQDTPEGRARAAQNAQRWRRNRPSLITDIALGVAFFFVAREYGLVTAAVGGAIAGLVLYGVQRLTKIDLLGGLAVFGIVISLISAGFALAFADEDIVKHRGTVMGLLVSGLFILDGLNRGRYLARRLSRYLVWDLDLGRLSLGMGVNGLAMPALNAVVAETTSTDVWLFYTTFADTLVGLVLFFCVLRWARVRQDAAEPQPGSPGPRTV